MDYKLEELDLESMTKEELINLVGELFDEIYDKDFKIDELRKEIDRMSDDEDEDFTYSMGLY